MNLDEFDARRNRRQWRCHATRAARNTRGGAAVERVEREAQRENSRVVTGAPWPRLPGAGWEAAALWTVFVAVVISLGLTTHGMSRAAVALWRPVGVSAETPAVVLDAGGTLLVPLVGGFEQYPSVQGTATQTNPPSTSRPTGRPI